MKKGISVMRGFKRKAALAAIGMVLCLTACNGKADGGNLFGNKQESSEDTPWNHGPYAIMETETGWYTSHGSNTYLCLRYYEKESGNTILLCNKPECMHEGDDGCEATYRSINVINTILYEGSIYVYGVQGKDGRLGGRNDSPKTDMVSLCLWRAALDGSSIDKVGTVFEAENAQGQKVEYPLGLYGNAQYDYSFIIHQGYAYLPYYLQFGTGQIGFQGGGIMKMELATGKTEEIYTMEAKINGVPSCLTAVGDTVYFYRHALNSTMLVPIYRYSITDKNVEPINLTWSSPEMLMHEKKHNMLYNTAVAFAKDRIYALAHTYQEDPEEDGELCILAFDAKTGELKEEECFETGISYLKKHYHRSPRIDGYYDVMPSPEGLLVTDGEGAYFYDVSGKKTGQIAFPREMLEVGEKEKNLTIDYKICGGKLYMIFLKQNGSDFYSVLSCPLEDIAQGKGEWKVEYKIQEILTYGRYLEITDPKRVQELQEKIRQQEEGEE